MSETSGMMGEPQKGSPIFCVCCCQPTNTQRVTEILTSLSYSTPSLIPSKLLFRSREARQGNEAHWLRAAQDLGIYCEVVVSSFEKNGLRASQAQVVDLLVASNGLILHGLPKEKRDCLFIDMAQKSKTNILAFPE